MAYRSRPISKFGWRSPWLLRSPAGIAPRHACHQAKGFARRRCSGRRSNTLSKSSTLRVMLPSLSRMVTVASPPSTAGFGNDKFGPERPVMGVSGIAAWRLLPAAPCRETHGCRQAAGQATEAASTYAWHMRHTLSLCPIVRKPKSGCFPSPTTKRRDVALSVNSGIP